MITPTAAAADDNDGDNDDAEFSEFAGHEIDGHRTKDLIDLNATIGVMIDSTVIVTVVDKRTVHIICCSEVNSCFDPQFKFQFHFDGTNSMWHAGISGFINSKLPTTPQDRVRSRIEHRPTAEVHEQ